jgi:hypothetical protein
MVCVEHTIGLEIILDAPDGTHTMELLGDLGHEDSCFGLFEDSVSAGAR